MNAHDCTSTASYFFLEEKKMKQFTNLLLIGLIFTTLIFNVQCIEDMDDFEEGKSIELIASLFRLFARFSLVFSIVCTCVCVM